MSRADQVRQREMAEDDERQYSLRPGKAGIDMSELVVSV